MGKIPQERAKIQKKQKKRTNRQKTQKDSKRARKNEENTKKILVLQFHFFNFGGDNWLTGYLFLQELCEQGNWTSVALLEFTASPMVWTECWGLG